MLGDLVANYISNTQGFTKPLVGARSSLKGFVGEVKSSISSISSAFAPLAAIVAPIAGAFALHKVVEDARAAAASAKKFQAVLDATGGAAGITTKEMQEFAGELQKTTNFEDDATVGAAAMLASFTNIRGSVFKEAVKSAMDLSAVMGVELPQAMRGIGMALNDPINGMNRLRKIGIQLTEEQKKQIANFQKQGNLTAAQGVILNAIQGKFGGAAQALASPFTQVKNIIGDISENIGFALLPVLKEIIAVVTEWATPIQNATAEFKQFGEDVAFIFRNFTDVFKVAGINMELAIIDAVPGAEHAFEELGATINALWEGAQAGWDAWLANVKGGISEIKNLFSAVVAGAGAAFDSISSGNVTGAAGAFADAFVKELSGQTDADALRNPFKEFGDAFAKAREDALKGFAEPGGGLAGGLRAERDKLLEDINAREDARAKQQRLPGELPGLPGETKKAEPRGIEAALAGSKEFYSSIFGAQRSGQSAADKQVDLLDKQNEKIDKTNELLQDLIDDSPDVEFVGAGL